MLSPRRSAQLGLFCSCLVLICSLTVLVAKAKDAYSSATGQPGQLAADFTLISAEGNAVSLSSLRGKTVVLYFSSARCPTNNDYTDRLAAFSRTYANRSDVEILAINSVIAANEQTDPSEIRVQSKVCGLEFPTLLDERSRVARLFSADMTPTFFVIDNLGVIRYRGAFDDNHDASLVNSSYCEDALEAVLNGEPVDRPLTPVFGCAIQ